MALQENGRLTKNSPESEARMVALILTAMVWLVVAALCILLPPLSSKEEPPQVYQSISLKLAALEGSAASPEPLSEALVSQAFSPDSTEASATTPPEASPLPEKSPAPAVATKPAEKSPAPAVATKPAEQAPSQKTVLEAPASSVAKPEQKAPAPAPSSAVKNLEVDSLDEAAWEALFAEKGGRTYNNSPSATIPAAPAVASSSASSSSLSGVAGASSLVEAADSSSAAASQGAFVSSQATNLAQGKAQSLSQSTASALEKIASVAEAGQGRTAADEGSATASAQATRAATASSASSGTLDVAGTSMDLVGGGSRRLLEPQEPVIVISSQNQSYIKGDTEVTITFEITPEGLVLPSSIKITPESLIPGQVQAEIKNQIEKWRFQVAKGSGQVRFKYNIIKK